MTPPLTPNGKLSDLARHVVVPSGLVSTGWPAVRDRCAEFGVRFDPWQDGVGRIILSKRADGSYATSIGGVVISIPRQVGKTFLFGSLVFGLCLLFPNLTVIWTAHRLRTADETFAKMQGFSRRRKIAPFVLKPRLGSGEQEIRFRNGSRILFGARERGFGRGFDLVDVLVFDEAQILTENAIDDMVPATNQAPNPLLLFSGTPPKPADPSEVFTSKREKALAGSSDDMAYVEFSADEKASPDDRKQWAKANPSYPKRTSASAILRMRENLTEDSFLREALGIWPASGGSVIPLDGWHACLDANSRFEGVPVLAVDVSKDRSRSAIAAAGLRADGLPHGEIIDERPGTGWVAGRLAELKTKHHPRRVLAYNGTGLVESVIRDAAAVGVEVESVSTSDFAGSCGRLFDWVTEGFVRHLDDPLLDQALIGASKRFVGDAWLLDRKNALVNIAPLVAFTLAVGAVGDSTKPLFAY